MKPLITLFFVAFSLPLAAQTTITHDYDATGNRVVRSSWGAMMMVPPPQTKNFWQTQIEETQVSDKKNVALPQGQYYVLC